ncbi:MAG: hypothetical protein AB8I08_28270 [Sandaracinaceae bacterium]
MSNDLEGPLNQSYALQSGTAAAGASDGELALHDGELVLMQLRGLCRSEADFDALKRVLRDDPRAAETLFSDPRVVREVARGLARGEILARHSIIGRSFRGEVGEGSADEEEPPEEIEEVKTRDWRIECGHHGSGSRSFIERGTVIQVVPDVASDGDHKDIVKLHWRDDYIGSLPPTLTTRSTGIADFEIAQSGSDGGYTVYDLEAKYRHDVDGVIPPFWLPSFWRAYNMKTQYSISPGPANVRVDVFHPHKWKFELKLPPWATFKDGHKWNPPDGAGVKALAKPKTLKKEFETEDTLWTPSKLSVDTTRTNTAPDGDFKPSESEMKLDSVKLSRDGKAVDLDALRMIGKLLKFQESWRDLLNALKKFREYAPEMGWYADVSLQLMQGGVAAEWYWKEHTDHRVFRFLDVNIQLTLFNLMFEVGLGVGAFSFKLQIFAQIGGEMGVSGGFQRDNPDAGAAMVFPKVTGKVVGALGARLEGGAFFKFEAKGETAVEAEVNMAINKNNSPFSADFRLRWTGITCTATGSVGIWGIGGTRTWTETLVQPSQWIGSELPSPTPYEPPHLSKARIKAKIKSTLTSGWNIRVIREVSGFFNDVDWTVDQIAELIASKIDADPYFNRTNDSVEGLAMAMRGDLDALGSRVGRDYIEEKQFLRYVNGSVGGKSLRSHIDRARSPERMVIAANR